MRVAILHGAISADANADDLDTLVQCDAIAAALRELGHAVISGAMDLDLAATAEWLCESRPDVVFNLVESVAGSDALLPLGPMLLNHLGLPFTGCDLGAIGTTTDKIVAKRLMRAAGLPTPDWWEAGGEGSASGGEYIVKSVTEHGSFALEEGNIAPAREVPQLLRHCTESFGGRWFAERFVAGREFNLAVLDGPDGPEVLPPAEIRFLSGARIVGYAAKWDEESHQAAATPRWTEFRTHDESLLAELRRLALACWHLFGLRGYARVDFRLDPEGQPFVLEVNANPCLSPGAGFATAAARAGMSFAAVVDRILSTPNRPPGTLSGVRRTEREQKGMKGKEKEGNGTQGKAGAEREGKGTKGKERE